MESPQRPNNNGQFKESNINNSEEKGIQNKENNPISFNDRILEELRSINTNITTLNSNVTIMKSDINELKGQMITMNTNLDKLSNEKGKQPTEIKKEEEKKVYEKNKDEEIKDEEIKKEQDKKNDENKKKKKKLKFNYNNIKTRINNNIAERYETSSSKKGDSRKDTIKSNKDSSKGEKDKSEKNSDKLVNYKNSINSSSNNGSKKSNNNPKEDKKKYKNKNLNMIDSGVILKNQILNKIKIQANKTTEKDTETKEKENKTKGNNNKVEDLKYLNKINDIKEKKNNVEN